MTPQDFVKTLFREDAMDSLGYEALRAKGIDDLKAFLLGSQHLFGVRHFEDADVFSFLTHLIAGNAAQIGLQKTLELQSASALPPSNFFDQYIRPNPKLWNQMLKAGPFVFQNLLRSTELWPTLANPTAMRRVLDPSRFAEQLRLEFLGFPQEPGEALFANLRNLYTRNLLTIGLNEISQSAPPDVTCRAISTLANVICQKSLEILLKNFVDQPSDPATRFFLLAMGKLGGMELNLSSDIDIIAFYENAPAETLHTSEHETFTRLIEQWIQLLSKVTENGFVYRVDLRLRPEGSRGPLVNSLEAGLRYYENWGSLWDRTAYLKARPLAGNLKVALTFLRQLEPFIFQRSVDFKLLDFLSQMKQKIKDEQIKKKRHRSKDAFDVKLDEGGIREIEFFVQMHQLLYGGRALSLRTPSTLPALQNMQELKLITPRAAEDLRDAYLFLRRVENLLQFYDNQQTHLLNPEDPQTDSIIDLMGYPTKNLFFEKLQHHRNRVHQYFENLLTERSVAPNTASNLTLGTKGETIFRLLLDHFDKPTAAHEQINILRQAAFSFESALAPYPDWKRFLTPLEQLCRATGRFGHLLEKISKQPKIAQDIFNIFYKSDFLTNLLLKDPSLLLHPPQYWGKSLNEDGAQALAEAMAKSNDRGEAMDALRVFCRQQVFAIGTEYLADQSQPENTREVQQQLTSLADLSICESARWITDELRAKYGLAFSEDGHPAHCLILGLGSLGAEELSFNSDLDLIFVYSANGKTQGPQVISNHEFFTLFAQRLISFLSMATAKGYAYKIDTRLRPSGRAGTLVTKQSSFFEYHQKSKTWEIQSLLRTRVIWGDPIWKTQFEENMRKTRQTLSDFRQIAQDILDMREKMMDERLEKSRPENNPFSFDIKLSKGGLTDIEFMAQYLQLKLSIAENTHTRELLLRFQTLGSLPPEKIQMLIAAYDRYRFILHQICLLSNHEAGSFLFLGMPRLDEIARMLSFDDAKGLLVWLQENAEEVHRMYLEILQNFA